ISMPGRQATELHVKNRHHVEQVSVGLFTGTSLERGLMAMPRGSDPGLGSHPGRHAIEPGTQAIRIANLRRLADEDEERRLKGLVRVVRTGQQATTHAPDHRPMTSHQRLESRFVPLEDVTLEQITVVRRRGPTPKETIQALKYNPFIARPHPRPP